MKKLDIILCKLEKTGNYVIYLEQKQVKRNESCGESANTS